MSDAANIEVPSPDFEVPAVEALIGTPYNTLAGVSNFYFPPELVGGTCPYIAGAEEEIVWNAAAEACGTERVHIAWQVYANRIWYLAVPSSALASHAKDWCPLATLLPSADQIVAPPVAYTYANEETMVMMLITADTLRIYHGADAVFRGRAERATRETGQTQIIPISASMIQRLRPVPWHSASLFEDRARRILATASVAVSLIIVGCSFVVWLLANMSFLASRYEASGLQEDAHNRSMQMVRLAADAQSSPLHQQIQNFLNINDGLLEVDGFLNVYEIKDGKTRWRAQIPAGVDADKVAAVGGKAIAATESGVVIGNDAELDYEAAGKEPQ